MKTPPEDLYILLQLDPNQQKCGFCSYHFNHKQTILYIYKYYNQSYQFTNRCFWCWLDGYRKYQPIEIEELSLLYHPQFIPYYNQEQWAKHANEIDNNIILYG